MATIQAPAAARFSVQSWIVNLHLQNLFPIAPNHQPLPNGHVANIPAQPLHPAIPLAEAGVPVANLKIATFDGHRAYRNIGTQYSVPSMQIDAEIQAEWENISESVRDDLRQLGRDLATGLLWMVGSRADRLRPTIVILCWNNEDCQTPQGRDTVRKRVRKVAKRFESLRGCSLPWKVAVSDIPLLAQLSASGTAQRSDIAAVEAHIPNGVSTLCGVSLLLRGQTSQAIDFCTLGGVLYLKDCVYGLTAGHPFDQTSGADPDSLAVNGTHMEGVFLNEQSDSEDSAFEDYEVESLDSDVFASLQAHPEVGGDFEHMQSKPFKSFGTLSGRPDGERCNSDWALININDQNTVLPNRYFPPGNNVLVLIDGWTEKTCPGGTTVTLLTAISGTVTGKIGQPHCIMRHGKWDLEVSQVIISKPLLHGDSGAWVVWEKKVCGIVVAGDRVYPWAYMIPFHVILKRIAESQMVPVDQISLQPGLSSDISPTLSENSISEEAHDTQTSRDQSNTSKLLFARTEEPNIRPEEVNIRSGEVIIQPGEPYIRSRVLEDISIGATVDEDRVSNRRESDERGKPSSQPNVSKRSGPRFSLLLHLLHTDKLSRLLVAMKKFLFGRTWCLATGTGLMMFMIGMDLSIIPMTIPTITRLSGTLIPSVWFGTLYCIAMVFGSALSGRIFTCASQLSNCLLSLAVFAVGTLICRTARIDSPTSTLRTIMGGRTLTGLGAGCILVCSTQALDLASQQARSAVWNLSCILYTLGIAVGPAFADSLLDARSWSWCFWVSLPFGAAGCFLIAASPSPQIKLTLPRISLPSKWLLFKAPLFLPREIYDITEVRLTRGPHYKMAKWRNVLGLMSIFAACGSLAGVFIGLSWGGMSFAWRSPEVISSLVAGGVLGYLATFLLWGEVKATRRRLDLLRIGSSGGRNVFSVPLLLCRFITGIGLHFYLYFLPIYFRRPQYLNPPPGRRTLALTTGLLAWPLLQLLRHMKKRRPLSEGNVLVRNIGLLAKPLLSLLNVMKKRKILPRYTFVLVSAFASISTGLIYFRTTDPGPQSTDNIGSLLVFELFVGFCIGYLLFIPFESLHIVKKRNGIVEATLGRQEVNLLLLAMPLGGAFAISGCHAIFMNHLKSTLLAKQVPNKITAAILHGAFPDTRNETTSTYFGEIVESYVIAVRYAYILPVAAFGYLTLAFILDFPKFTQSPQNYDTDNPENYASDPLQDYATDPTENYEMNRDFEFSREVSHRHVREPSNG